jgi:hypothetical protein
MTGRRYFVLLGAATLVASGAACALDFDRFEPDDASASPSGDVSSARGPTDASAMEDVAISPTIDAEPSEDAEATDGGADARALTDGAWDDAAPCSPPPSCIMSAQTCGAGCVRTEQQCAGKCGLVGGSGCRSTCTRTETTCVTQCEDTCSSCSQSAGCSATAGCADAAR